MVCKKCGIKINKDTKKCPNCGVWQEKNNKEKINKLEKELESLKMGESPSSFSNGKVHPNIKEIPKIDVSGIINDLEDLKIKEDNNSKLSDATPKEIDTEDLEEVIENIQENRELFITSYDDELDENNDENLNIETEKYTEPFETYKLNQKENKIRYKDNIKKHNNKRNFIIGLSIFAFLFIIAIFMLYTFALSPKAKFMNALEAQYSNIINKINNITNNFDDIFNSQEIQLNTTAKVTSTENGKTNNYIISSKYLESDKEQKQYFEYSNLNQTMTELKKLYIQNNKLYINQENMADKYYVVDSKYISLKNFLKTDNIDYITRIISKTTNKILNNNNFNTKKTNIEIDDNNYKVSEISLILDEKLYSKIYTEILKEIKADKTALHILTDYTKYSMDEVKKLIDNKINFLKNQNSEETKLTYKMYINEAHNVIKQELNYDENVIEYLNVNNKQEIKVTNNDVTTLLFNSQTKDSKTTFSITTDYVLKGEYIKEKASNIINLQITDNNNNNMIINSTFMKNTNEKENNRYDVFMAVQSNGFNNQNYIKNIEIVNTLEATSHFEIVDIPIQKNITAMPTNQINELKENFSMFIK